VQEGTVFVVDDDQAVRTALARLMQSVDLPVETFPSAEAFLADYHDGRAGCLVLDIRMSGMSGLDLQALLAERKLSIPIIIISAHGDVESAVRAMKAGAVDFLSKPYKPAALLDRVRQALQLDATWRRDHAARAAGEALLAKLSPRERQVMERMVQGAGAKQIALELGLSRKTVDIHRAHIMMKLNAESVADVVRLALLVRHALGPINP
jgi:FixJ family two-component response regulator